jgi:hypothetical protein
MPCVYNIVVDVGCFVTTKRREFHVVCELRYRKGTSAKCFTLAVTNLTITIFNL